MTTALTAGPYSWLVPPVPGSRMSARVARKLLERAAARVGVSISHDGSSADIQVIRPAALYARLGSSGLIGLGEAYVAGDWEADNLAEALTPFCAEIESLVPLWMQWCRSFYLSRRPRSQRNSIANARCNISHHYDLSNEFFATFLDPSMSYSSALFEEPGLSLHEAQLRKIDRVLDQAGVREGSRVLEIGTGWGELAIRAARRGARVRSVTLSVAQRDLARARVASAGMSGHVDVDLMDYREVRGRYDAIVSVEMVEAVGYEYWDVYMATIADLLVPTGRVVIQAITMSHHRMLATRDTATWITTYIFPGGCVPSVRALNESAQRAGLRRSGLRSFGGDYAETLLRWDRVLASSSAHLDGLGFDDSFRRLWHFYLEYCRAGFASGYIDVSQTTYVPVKA